MPKQCRIIYEHMRTKGPITSKMAADMYGIQRLASRISDLKQLGIELFQWAAQKTEKTIPPVIAQSYEKWKEDRRRKNLAAIKQKEETEAKPAPPNGGDEMKIMMSQLLAAQRKTNELLESLLDVVIPKYVGDLKDNINVNCDVINQTAKSCEDKLEAIKLAFRKKGL